MRDRKKKSASKSEAKRIEPYVQMRFPAHVELHQPVERMGLTTDTTSDCVTLSARFENDKVYLTMNDGQMHAYGGTITSIIVRPEEMAAWCLAMLHELPEIEFDVA